MKKRPSKLTTIGSFILVAGILLLPTIVSHNQKKNPSNPLVSEVQGGDSTVAFMTPLAIGGTMLSVAVADTDAKRTQGLSGTALLSDKEGMLFVFPKPALESFWMKDMNYSLDIIWISSDKKVVDITHDLAPSTYPATVTPKVPVSYVLEVPAGFAEKNGIVEGSDVTF